MDCRNIEDEESDSWVTAKIVSHTFYALSHNVRIDPVFLINGCIHVHGLVYSKKIRITSTTYY